MFKQSMNRKLACLTAACAAITFGTIAQAAVFQTILSVDFNLDEATDSPTLAGFNAFSLPSTDASSGTIAQSFGEMTVTLIGDTTTSLKGRDRGEVSGGVGFNYSDLHRDFVQGLERTGAPTDAVATTAATATSFTISGLAANTQHQIQLWNLDKDFNNGNNLSWWDTTNGTGDDAVFIGSIENSTSPNPATNDDFSVTGLVTSDATGTLRFGATNTAPQAVFINGLELGVIPEPGSLALLGLGSLMILGRRRTA